MIILAAKTRLFLGYKNLKLTLIFEKIVEYLNKTLGNYSTLCAQQCFYGTYMDNS